MTTVTIAAAEAEQKIRQVLADVARLRADPLALPAEADLYGVGLSSLATVDVMMSLEDRFGVEFPERLLNRRTFGSIGAIRSAIAELLLAA
jgi:acyl carrier protein